MQATGAIIYTANTRHLEVDEIIESCPYNIPRKAEDGTLAKCDMCLDRVQNGLLPACVKTCPTGAMNFGDRDKMFTMAQERLGAVKKNYPGAALLDADSVNVIYLIAFDPDLYHEFAVASNVTLPITRQVALRRMFRPVTNRVSRLL